MVVVLCDPHCCSLLPFFHMLSQGMCILVNILLSVLSFTHHIWRKFFLAGEWGGIGACKYITHTKHISCISEFCRWINLLMPKDDYSGRTAPLTSKRCILYIYSTNIGTEYFKHGIYSPFFPLQNAVCFINVTYLVPVLFTFYIQGVLKLKK